MKTNYNIVMENIIQNLTTKPKLLLHACCGICSGAVVERLNEYFDITILYYNPNIYPKDEYYKRLDVLKKLIFELKLDIKILEIGYDEDNYYTIIKGLENEKEGGKRCNLCYWLRMEKTAKKAKELGYDYFCTTLSISPYKRSEQLNKIGAILEKKYNINYLYSDFKKKNGFKRSNELSYKYNLYRQNYCGCIFSKEETEIYFSKTN